MFPKKASKGTVDIFIWNTCWFLLYQAVLSIGDFLTRRLLGCFFFFLCSVLKMVFLFARHHLRRRFLGWSLSLMKLTKRETKFKWNSTNSVSSQRQMWVLRWTFHWFKGERERGGGGGGAVKHPLSIPSSLVDRWVMAPCSIKFCLWFSFQVQSKTAQLLQEKEGAEKECARLTQKLEDQQVGIYDSYCRKCHTLVNEPWHFGQSDLILLKMNTQCKLDWSEMFSFQARLVLTTENSLAAPILYCNLFHCSTTTSSLESVCS